VQNVQAARASGQGVQLATKLAAHQGPYEMEGGTVSAAMRSAAQCGIDQLSGGD
jgi:hypothetical protein